MKVNIGPYRVKRKVSVEIHDYDTWNADHTLALIIHPLLIKFSEQPHGYPADLTEDEWDTIIDKMIFSFSCSLDSDWEDQFYINTRLDSTESLDDSIKSLKIIDNFSDLKFDKEGYEKFVEKIDEGLSLFAKYYRHLWT